MKDFILIISLLKLVNSAKILAVFCFPTMSHHLVFQPIVKELAALGHEVTFLTSNPINDPTLQNLSEIDMSVTYTLRKLPFINRTNNNFIKSVLEGSEFAEYITSKLLEEKAFAEILRKPENTYDLILIDSMMTVLFGFQHKFKAPLISVSSVPMYMSTHYFIGNPIHPFLYPEVTSGLANPVTTFRDKLDSLYIFLVIYFLQEFYMISRYDAIAKKHFGEDMPDLREMIKKTSFFFDYGNPFLSFRRPLAANHKEVWNIRTLETALPKDLQHIIDNAKNGVVYFSLGTTVSLAHLENEIKNTMLEVLSELPYTVLCKWDEEFDGKSDNLLVRKMFPQRSILAHPKVKLFITHAGIQSAEEALLNGVPMVVIPITYDQPFNSKQLKKYGVAEIVHLSTLTKDSMKEAIYKVAEEKEYRAKAKEISKILLDQPRSGLDEIMWWCEYVIRHKGAAHLRSPAADISLYDYFMLDVLVVVLICSWLIYKMIIISLRMIIRFLKEKNSEEKKKKN